MKKNQFYIIFTYKWSKLFKNPKFLKIADDHNFRIEYARNMKFVA